MPKFHIEITETLSEILEIEAKDISQAITVARHKYLNEEIVLDGDSHVATEFSEYQKG